MNATFQAPRVEAARVSMRAGRWWVLCAVVGLFAMAQAATVLGQPSHAEQRFAVRATLEAEPQAASDGRFSLRGRLTPRPSANIAESVGFVLKADLLAKGGDTCIFPQRLFADGFESSPPWVIRE